MRNFILTTALASLAITATMSSAQAAVTLLEQNDWKVQMSGFVEVDAFNDSTRSLTEVIGNTPIDRSPSTNGDNGRTEMSVRNSRLAFSVLPPINNDWKSKGYLEFDLLGFDPSPNGDSAKGATNSEGGFYTNPSLRVRHAYLSMEKNGWNFLAGQTWTLFGWQTAYMLNTVSVAPGPGVIYQRTPQITAMKTFVGESTKVQVGASAERPTQKDSQIPNLDLAARILLPGYTSGLASATGEAALQPASVGVSATYKSFKTANGSAANSGMNSTTGLSYALDALVPIVPSSDGKDISNTLSFTGEFSVGQGDGDAYPGWSGNLPQLPQSSLAATSQTNVDAGIGGLDSSNNFTLIQIQSWNAQLQYHFAQSTHLFATVGYGQLSATNMSTNYLVASGKTQYDRESIYFANLFYDMTTSIRFAAEYSKIGTHYIDDFGPSDQRYQVSAWLRF